MFDVWFCIGMVFCFACTFGYFKGRCRTLEKAVLEEKMRANILQDFIKKPAQAEASCAPCTFYQEVETILHDLKKFKPVGDVLELRFPVEVKDDGEGCLRTYTSGEVMIHMKVAVNTPLDSEACQSKQNHDPQV